MSVACFSTLPLNIRRNMSVMVTTIESANNALTRRNDEDRKAKIPKITGITADIKNAIKLLINSFIGILEINKNNKTVMVDRLMNLVNSSLNYR